MAGYSTTYSGDLTTTIAGKLYAAVKKRIEKNRDKADEEKEELKSATREAESKVITPTPTPVADKSGRQYVSKMLGGGVVLKMVQVESKAAQTLQSINEIKAITAQNNKLIIDHNEMLIGKLDILLSLYQQKLAHDKKLADDAETAKIGGSGGGAGTQGYVNNILKKPKSFIGNLIKDLLLRRAKSAIGRVGRMLPRRLRARGRLLSRRIGPVARAALRPRAAAKAALNRYAQQGAKKLGINLGAKGAAKVGLKTVGKKLPFGIGLGISAIFAAQRLFQKPPDPMGAALELASGAAAFVPGVGTAASLAIDAGIAARDATKDQQYETGTKGLTKKGLAILHGTERVDRVDPNTGLATSLIEETGSQLVSVAMKYARDSKVDRQIQPEISRLPFKLVNIPFATGVKRTRTKTTSNAFFNRTNESLSYNVDRRTAEEVEEDESGEGNLLQRLQRALNPGGGGGGDDPPYPSLEPPTTGASGAVIQFWGQQGPDKSGEPGLDFSFADYQSNYAVFPGIVTFVGASGSGYGNIVRITSTDSSNGKKFDQLYAHFPNGGIAVKKGDAISTGDYLGKVGYAGVQGPNGGAAYQGNGAGRMSGYHTSLDFYEPGTYTAYSNYRGLVSKIMSHANQNVLSIQGSSKSAGATKKHQGPIGGIGDAGPGYRPRPGSDAAGNKERMGTDKVWDSHMKMWVPTIRHKASANTPMVGIGGPNKEKGTIVTDRDYAAMIAISALEGGTSQARVDVAQSIMNRLGDRMYGNSLYSIITADEQYQPAYINPGVAGGPGAKTSPEWKAIVDKKTAIAAMQSYYWRRHRKKVSYNDMLALYNSTETALKNKKLRAAAAAHVGGRTEFLGSGVELHRLDKPVQRWRGGVGDNKFFAAYGSQKQLQRGPQAFPYRLLLPPGMTDPRDGIVTDKKRMTGLKPTKTDWEWYMRQMRGQNRSSLIDGLTTASADVESIEEGLSVLPIVLNKTVIIERQVASSSGSISSSRSSFDPLAYQMSRLAT